MADEQIAEEETIKAAVEQVIAAKAAVAETRKELLALRTIYDELVRRAADMAAEERRRQDLARRR